MRLGIVIRSRLGRVTFAGRQEHHQAEMDTVDRPGPIGARPICHARLSTPPLCELRPDEGGGIVIDVRGDVTLEAAVGILRLASTLHGVTRVAINLDAISAISVEAAEVLLFHDGREPAGGHAPVTVLANGRIIRDAVLLAYARRRAQEPWATDQGGAW